MATYVKSDTQSWFGRLAVNWRSTKSGIDRGLVRARGDDEPPAAHDPAQVQRLHQPFDGAARGRNLLTPQLPPDFLGAVDLFLFVPHARDLSLQLVIALRAGRAPRRIGRAGPWCRQYVDGAIGSCAQIDSTP